MNLIEPTNLFDDIQLSVRFSDVPQQQAAAQFAFGECVLFDDIRALPEVAAQKAGVPIDEPFAARGVPAVSLTPLDDSEVDGVALETGYARAPNLRCGQGRGVLVTSPGAVLLGGIQAAKLMLAYVHHAGPIIGFTLPCPRFSHPSGRGTPPLSHFSALKPEVGINLRLVTLCHHNFCWHVFGLAQLADW